MKIITCASYYGSGSSALTDLIAEYEGVKCLTNYEFRFIHDLDGIVDLEYHLCDCHNRHNSGHALKRFWKLSKFNAGNKLVKRYEPFFNNQYLSLTREYISWLTDFSFNGWWFYDLYDKGEKVYYFYQGMDKILKRITRNKYRILAKEITLCAHPSREKFITCTQEYIHKLFEAANREKLAYLEVDQIVSSQNINRISRYFRDELFIFVVDRDPRDVYTLSKFYWKDKVNPYNDVQQFCDWYIYTRNSGGQEQVDSSHVKTIHFEDMIYRYEKVKKDIESFVGLTSKEHMKPFSKFNPKRSVNNTRVWERHNIKEDIKVIEERLKEYLYPFHLVEGADIRGIEPNDREIF